MSARQGLYESFCAKASMHKLFPYTSFCMLGLHECTSHAPPALGRSSEGRGRNKSPKFSVFAPSARLIPANGRARTCQKGGKGPRSRKLLRGSPAILLCVLLAFEFSPAFCWLVLALPAARHHVVSCNLLWIALLALRTLLCFLICMRSHVSCSACALVLLDLHVLVCYLLCVCSRATCSNGPCSPCNLCVLRANWQCDTASVLTQLVSLQIIQPEYPQRNAFASPVLQAPDSTTGYLMPKNRTNLEALNGGRKAGIVQCASNKSSYHAPRM